MNAEHIAQYLNSLTPAGERRLDARETAALTRQLEMVKSKTYDIQYPGLKARQFIPVSSEANTGANAITYRQWDQYGMAKVISNFADDLPRVDVSVKEFTTPVQSIGDAYGFSIQELRAAAMSGSQLDTKRASAARRAFEACVDEIAAFGVPDAGLTGFLNHANVGSTSPDTGTWTGATTPANILRDMNKLVQAVIIQTKQVWTPDTLLLPTAAFALISQTFMSADNNMTILRAFLANNPYIKNVDQWVKLDLADAEGDGPRMVCYARNPEVVELEIPQEFEQFPPQWRNLEAVIPCHGRIGGTVIRYPLAMEYMDGI